MRVNAVDIGARFGAHFGPVSFFIADLAMVTLYSEGISLPTMVLFIGAALIWGSTDVAITFQLAHVAPAVSVVYRFAIASSCLFRWCALRGDRLWLPWKTQRWLIFQGVTTFGITYVSVYHAERYVPSGLMSVLFVLVIFWRPVCERIGFGKPLTWEMWSGAGAACCGVVMMCARAIDATWARVSDGGGGRFFIGFGLALAATLTFAMGGVSAIKIREHSANALLTLAWAMFWGAFPVALWVALTGTPWCLPTESRYWISLCYLSLFGSVLTFSACFTLVHRIGAQKAMYIDVVTPAIAVLLSMRWQQYRPVAIEWCGIALALSSVVWAFTPRFTRSRSGLAARAPKLN